MNISEILEQHNEKSGIDWDNFIKEVAEKITPEEVRAYAEGYLEGVEAVYQMLIKEPTVSTRFLMEIKEAITFIGGDLYGES